MNTALLLVGHGSRVPEGNAQFVALADRVRAAAPGLRVEHCFIELAEPDIPAGLDRCVAQGAGRVAVLPVTLFAAKHAKVEIPEHIDAARTRHPGVEFRYGRPFGVDPTLLAVLRQRFAEWAAGAGPVGRADAAGAAGAGAVGRADAAGAAGAGAADPAETAVVVVGRGSSDPDANSDLVKLARMFQEHEGLALVDVAYTAVARPDLATAVRRAVRLGARQVAVMPYLLFTGVLVQRLHRDIAALQEEFPGIPIRPGRYLGEHPDLAAVLLDRMQEALAGGPRMSCDLCGYRVLTA